MRFQANTKKRKKKKIGYRCMGLPCEGMAIYYYSVSFLGFPTWAKIVYIYWFTDKPPQPVQYHP
jgi:hypothetical protein